MELFKVAIGKSYFRWASDCHMRSVNGSQCVMEVQLFGKSICYFSALFVAIRKIHNIHLTVMMASTTSGTNLLILLGATWKSYWREEYSFPVAIS